MLCLRSFPHALFMKNVSSAIGILTALALIVGCSQQPALAPTPSPSTPTVSSTQGTASEYVPEDWEKEWENVTPLEVPENHYKLRYPTTWTVKHELDNTTVGDYYITAQDNDQDTVHGGTYLLLQSNHTQEEVLKDFEESSTDSHVNWTGRKFDLVVYKPKSGTALSESSRIVGVKNEMFKQPIFFMYDEVKNPNGMNQLGKYLEGFLPLE